MAIKGNSIAERLSRWQLLVSNAKESEPLPYITEEIAQLEAMLAQARELQSRVEHHRAQVREVNAEILQLARDGDRVRRRVGASLHGKFGFTSEVLIRYGFKPRKVFRRRPKAAPQAEQQTVPAPSVAGAPTEP